MTSAAAAAASRATPSASSRNVENAASIRSEELEEVAVDDEVRAAVGLRSAYEAQGIGDLRIAVARRQRRLGIVTAHRRLERAGERERSAEVAHDARDRAFGRRRERRFEIAEHGLRRARAGGVAPDHLAARLIGPETADARFAELALDAPEQLERRDVERRREQARGEGEIGVAHYDRTVAHAVDDAVRRDLAAAQREMRGHLSDEERRHVDSPIERADVLSEHLCAGRMALPDAARNAEELQRAQAV